VAELADQLALGRFAIVGVSGGAPCALACAARIPDHVRRVALVGGLGPAAGKQLACDMVRLNRLVLGLAVCAPPLARVAIHLAAPSAKAGAAWERLAQPWDFDLREVNVPVRIWQGLADKTVPMAMAHHLAAALPYSECYYFPAEGYLSLIVRYLEMVLADLCS